MAAGRSSDPQESPSARDAGATDSAGDIKTGVESQRIDPEPLAKHANRIFHGHPAAVNALGENLCVVFLGHMQVADDLLNGSCVISTKSQDLVDRHLVKDLIDTRHALSLRDDVGPTQIEEDVGEILGDHERRSWIVLGSQNGFSCTRKALVCIETPFFLTRKRNLGLKLGQLNQ